MFLSILVILLLDIITFGFITFLILGIVLVLEVFAYWNVLKKMGEPGWKSFIPFYNDYTLYKHVWGRGYFFSNLGVSIIQASTKTWSKTDSGTIINLSKTILLIITGVVACLFSIVFCMKLAAAFGRSKLFGLGLLILSPLFMMILAYGSSYYLGDDNYSIY